MSSTINQVKWFLMHFLCVIFHSIGSHDYPWISFPFLRHQINHGLRKFSNWYIQFIHHSRSLVFKIIRSHHLENILCKEKWWENGHKIESRTVIYELICIFRIFRPSQSIYLWYRFFGTFISPFVLFQNSIC